MQKVTIDLTTTTGSPVKLQFIGNSIHVYHNDNYVGLLTVDNIIRLAGRKEVIPWKTQDNNWNS